MTTDPHIAVSDAIVAIRSFPRRFREVVAGPVGDDSWDRIVRTVAHGQTRSALGWTHLASQMLGELGRTVAMLATNTKPSASIAAQERLGEPGQTLGPTEVLSELASAATMAAVATEARTSNGWERVIAVDGADQTAHDLLSAVVHAVSRHLRDARVALDAAIAAA